MENRYTYLNRDSVILEINVWGYNCLQKGFIDTYGLCSIGLRTLYVAWLFALYFN